jgi:hypothetical protein
MTIWEFWIPDQVGNDGWVNRIASSASGGLEC